MHVVNGGYRSEYRQAAKKTRMLYDKLSKHTKTYNRYRDLKKLVKDVVRRYKIDLSLPRYMNAFMVINIAERLLNDDELNEKLTVISPYKAKTINDKVESYLNEYHIQYERDAHIGKYVVDFVLSKYDIVIELVNVDKYVNADEKFIVSDMTRITYIAHKGYRLYRIPNKKAYNRKLMMKILDGIVSDDK